MGHNPTHLKIGELLGVTIQARRKWNNTYIQVKQEEEYSLLAAGEWIDLFIRSGPGGIEKPNSVQKLFAGRKRVPASNYFALIGAIDRDMNSAFEIGNVKRKFHPPRDGILYCFANDVPYAYWNNRGEVTLTVKRIM